VSYDADYSLSRDNQRGAILGQALYRTLGAGVISGGVVEDATGLSARLVAPTVLMVGGVAWLVSANVVYSSLIDGVTNTLWAIITKTAANQTDPSGWSLLDTYALTLQATDDDDPPSAIDGWFRLAYLPVASGAITGGNAGIDNAPPGKYLGEPLLSALRTNTIQGRSAPVGLGVSAFSVAGTGVYTAKKSQVLAPFLDLTGALTGNRQLELPYTANAIFQVYNHTTGAFSLTVRVAGQTGIVVAQNRVAWLFMYGGDVRRLSADTDPTV